MKRKNKNSSILSNITQGIGSGLNSLLYRATEKPTARINAVIQRKRAGKKGKGMLAGKVTDYVARKSSKYIE